MRTITPEHEAQCHELRSEFGRQAVAHLRATCHPRAEEYINEAEHMEGCEVWDAWHGGKMESVMEDFRLFLEN
jgi:hypothetical protein